MGAFGKDEPEGYEAKTGAMWYKSGWMKQKHPGFFAKGPNPVWVQHRYGYTYIYTDHQRGYNWGSNAAPPEDQDDSILDKLHLPSISMPDISMPDVSMPDVSMPSMSMPSVSMPSLGGKGLFKRKKRQPNPREYIRLHNSKVKKSGKTLSITGATVYYYYEKDPNEEKNDQKVELTADDDDQAESWFETFKLCGCQEA